MNSTSSRVERAPVIVRPSLPEDRPFIISGFLRSLRSEGHYSQMSNDVYYASLHPEALRLAHGPVVIAHPPHDPWLILGFIAYESEPPALGYAYTRFSFRRMGVFDALLRELNPQDLPLPCRHVGRTFQALQRRYNFSYHPR